MTETPNDDVTETTPNDEPAHREPTPPDGEVTDVPNVIAHAVLAEGQSPYGPGMFTTDERT